MFQAPKLTDLTGFDVNRAGQYEAIRSSLYDFQTYLVGGQASLTFYQAPVGQAGKTLEDTNMQSAGQLPQPQYFLVQNIQVYFYPGTDPSVGGLDPQSTQVSFINDVWTLMKSGWLEFFIGSKNYVQEGPIGRFPPRNGLIVSSSLSDTTTSAAAQECAVGYANFGGAPYSLQPNILLTPNQNFNVKLNWPAALPIAVEGRIGVVMEGLLYRLSQ
jgi:hypothetical protein